MHPILEAGVLVAIYTLLGMPYGYTFKALPGLLKWQGYRESQISWTQSLKALWSVKVIFAPVMDRFYFRSLGKHRTWMMIFQVSNLLLGLQLYNASMAWDSRSHMVGLFLMNLVGASQDIIADSVSVTFHGYAAVEVIGYNVGMALAGGQLPECNFPMHSLCDASGAHAGSMFGLLAITSAPALLALICCGQSLDREDHVLEGVDFRAIWQRFAGAVSHQDGRHLLILVFAYQFVDAGIDTFWHTYLVDRGHDVKELASLYKSSLPLTVMLLSLVGFLSPSKRRSLQWCLSVSQGVAHLFRSSVAQSQSLLFPFYLFSKAAGTASVLLTKYRVLRQVDPAIAASHYSFFSFLEFLGKYLGSVLAGPFIEAFGYETLCVFGFGNAIIVAWLLMQVHEHQA